MLNYSCIGLTVMIRENKMAGSTWQSKMLTTCLGYKKVVVVNRASQSPLKG